ncbi:MAG TPA: rhomboid family intramembrane serine protease [Bryobacteraceae bacterium]|nr:rhomboid family intramembrane serine protease [Bryobacteraceae bacterium]
MIPLRDLIRSRTTPMVTVALILANVLVFFYMLSLDSYSTNHFISQYALTPDRFRFTAVVTSMFLHGGWMHLIGNMWFLWIYGDNVEDVLGHGKYLLFYLACGVAASLAQYMVSPDSRVPTLGASGAIAGVMGAYLIKFPHSRIVTLIPIFFFFTTIEIPAALILAYWFILQFFSGIGSVGYSQVSQGGVAWFAHIGGFVAGMVLINILGTREPYRRRRDLPW